MFQATEGPRDTFRQELDYALPGYFNGDRNRIPSHSLTLLGLILYFAGFAGLQESFTVSEMIMQALNIDFQKCKVNHKSPQQFSKSNLATQFASSISTYAVCRDEILQTLPNEIMF